MFNELSNVINSFTSGIAPYTATAIIWCVVLIVIGFNRLRYRKKMLIIGVWFYAISMLIPALQYAVVEFVTLVVPYEDVTGGFLQHAMIVLGVLASCLTALSVAYALLAIITSGESNHASTDDVVRVQTNDDSTSRV